METLQLFNNIHFSYINRRPRIDRPRIKQWLNQVALKEKVNIVLISYSFCCDEKLLEINQIHLNHDYYTDIITFDLSDKKKRIEGDIYISIDRIKENAKQLGYDFPTELLRVLVHGLLHLIGYSDKTKLQAAKMRELENKYISLYKSMFHVE